MRKVKVKIALKIKMRGSHNKKIRKELRGLNTTTHRIQKNYKRKRNKKNRRRMKKERKRSKGNKTIRANQKENKSN